MLNTQDTEQQAQAGEDAKIRRASSLFSCTLCPTFKAESALITKRKKSLLSVESHILEHHKHLREEDYPAFITLWGLRFYHHGEQQDIERSTLEAMGPPEYYTEPLNLKNRSGSFLRRFKTCSDRQKSETPDDHSHMVQDKEIKSEKDSFEDKASFGTKGASKVVSVLRDTKEKAILKRTASQAELGTLKPSRSKQTTQKQDNTLGTGSALSQPKAKPGNQLMQAEYNKILAKCHQTIPWHDEIIDKAFAQAGDQESSRQDSASPDGYPLFRPIDKPGPVDQEILAGKWGNYSQKVAAIVFTKKYGSILNRLEFRAAQDQYVRLFDGVVDQYARALGITRDELELKVDDEMG